MKKRKVILNSENYTVVILERKVKSIFYLNSIVFLCLYVTQHTTEEIMYTVTGDENRNEENSKALSHIWPS